VGGGGVDLISQAALYPDATPPRALNFTALLPRGRDRATDAERRVEQQQQQQQQQQVSPLSASPVSPTVSRTASLTVSLNVNSLPRLSRPLCLAPPPSPYLSSCLPLTVPPAVCACAGATAAEEARVARPRRGSVQSRAAGDSQARGDAALRLG
jgi:hypothetical protein